LILEIISVGSVRIAISRAMTPISSNTTERGLNEMGTSLRK
jgi:hypothetical protein